MSAGNVWAVSDAMGAALWVGSRLRPDLFASTRLSSEEVGMKRRAFLSLLGLSPVAIPTVASALSAPKETRRWFQVWKPKTLDVPKELVEFYEGVWRVMAQHCVPSESVDAWVHEKALDTVRAIYR